MTDDPPGPVESELLAAFGSVIHRWAYIESMQGQLLAYLLDANQALMQVVSANVSASTVTDWIRILLSAKYHEGPELERATSLLTVIDDLRSRRNALVHGLWEPHVPGAAKVQTIRWERSEIIKHEVVTLADLNDLVAEIGDALRALADLTNHIGTA